MQTWKATEVFGTGWPANAGGRLVGSLAALPYALAEAEQNFLIPTREQALIWGDLVPQMILSAVIPRWWDVTPLQLHWVGLHMRTAKRCWPKARSTRSAGTGAGHARIVRAAGADQEDRGDCSQAGDVKAAEDNVVPSEMYLLARRARSEAIRTRPLAADIRRIAAQAAEAGQPASHFARCSERPSPRSPIRISRSC